MDTPSRPWRTVLLAVGASLVIAAIATGLLVSSGSLEATSDPGNDTVSEEAAELEVPEPGDPWFEAQAADGTWVSYINPRDEYRSPYLGDGSGKICVTLLNEAGDPIVGESVPGTTVTVPTGDSLDWHSYADPMTVQYPLTEHYDRPLDADQFGTADDVIQGDGYLDSHCLEIHGLSEDGDSVEYGEAIVEGAHADRIEIVGYIQQEPAGTGWDSDVDPVDDAVSYEEAGGGWTYTPESSHGQVVIVLQLTGDAPADDGSDDTGSDDDGDDGTSDDSASDDGETDDTTGAPGEEDDGGDDTAGDENAGSDDDASDDDDADDESTGTDSSQGEANDEDGSSDEPDEDGLSGFGSLVALAAITGLLVTLIRTRRWE